jgi:serine-type D-Ala-D-Ala carboxypeptidase (penicillin-binding protein 5/6)
MKKTVSFILSLIIFWGLNPKGAKAAENPPVPTADSAVLMDAETGTILYSKNMDIAYPPASTTKILTALLTLEKTSLGDSVTVGKNPPFADGSAVGIREGEVLTVKDLLYGLLLESGNDCAEALAEHISGSKEKFAELMNSRASELGALNSNFVNPNGLYNKEHKSSAKDMALIMRELIKYPEFKQIATTPIYKIEPTNKCDVPRYANNKNKLVLKGYSTYYKDSIGGKTGYTIDSQHSYMAAAERNGQKLIIALIHDSKKTYFEDSVALFNYGFNNYELKRLYTKGDEISSYKISEELIIPLLAGEDFSFVKEKNSSSDPHLSITESDIKNKSFVRGEKIAEAAIIYNDTTLGKINLASGIDYHIKPVAVMVEKGKEVAPDIFKFFVYMVLSLLFILFLLLMIRKRNIRRRRLQNTKYYSGRYSRNSRHY